MRAPNSSIGEFEKLTFKQQARAMNAWVGEFRKMLEENLRKAEKEGQSREDVLNARLLLLKKIIRDY